MVEWDVPQDSEFDGSPTDILAKVGDEIWGPEWAGRMAQFANVNLRTCQRLAAAARVRTERPSAEVMLRAVRKRLAGVALSADPTAGNLQTTAEDDPDTTRWLVYEAIFGEMTKRDVWTAKPDDEVAGPYTVGDLRVILDLAADIEASAAKLTAMVVDAHNAPSLEDAQRILRAAAAKGAATIGAMIERHSDGEIGFATEGDPAFSESAFEHWKQVADENQRHGPEWFTSAMLLFNDLPTAERAGQVLEQTMGLSTRPATMLHPETAEWTPALLLADNDMEVTPMIFALTDSEDELAAQGIEVVATYEAQPRLENSPFIMGARPTRDRWRDPLAPPA